MLDTAASHAPMRDHLVTPAPLGDVPAPHPLEAEPATWPFAARVEHELRTPLNSVIGFSGLLLRGPATNLTDQQHGYVTRIRDNGLHLLAVVEHLVAALERRSAGNVAVRRVALADVVRLATGEMAAEAGRTRVAMSERLAAGAEALVADEAQLAAAVRALLLALLPLAARGTLDVALERAPDGAWTLAVTASGPFSAQVAGYATPTELLPALAVAASLFRLLGWSLQTSRSSGDALVVDVRPAVAA